MLRIWWFPRLSRGKLHVDIFDEKSPGETPEGAAGSIYVFFEVTGSIFAKRLQKNYHLDVIFGVFGSTFSKRVQKERSAAKLEKRPWEK